MGRLQYAIDALNEMQAGARPETEQEIHVQAITESLVDLTERLEKALTSKKPIQPNDYTESLARIAAALGQKTELGPLIEAIKGIDLSPTVNVEAPSVNVEKSGPMLFTINRDDMGYIKSVLATPYMADDADHESDDYEIE